MQPELIQSAVSVQPIALYDRDYQLWLEQTVAPLRAGDGGFSAANSGNSGG